MIRFVNRMIGKFANLIYQRGYIIKFEELEFEPDFEKYKLKDLGTWLLNKGDYWICLSELKKEEFTIEFFKRTDLPQDKVKIEFKSYPFTTLG